jgi:hypothetical protein
MVRGSLCVMIANPNSGSNNHPSKVSPFYICYPFIILLLSLFSIFCRESLIVPRSIFTVTPAGLHLIVSAPFPGTPLRIASSINGISFRGPFSASRFPTQLPPTSSLFYIFFPSSTTHLVLRIEDTFPRTRPALRVVCYGQSSHVHGEDRLSFIRRRCYCRCSVWLDRLGI